MQEKKHLDYIIKIQLKINQKCDTDSVKNLLPHKNENFLSKHNRRV
jgi:hypothetical protein